MKNPTTIDEIFEYVTRKHSSLNWYIGKRFDELNVLCDLDKTRLINLHPHQFNEDYNNKGIYTVSFGYDGKMEGRGCGCDDWEGLSYQIDRLLIDLKIVKNDTQMSIFDLL